MKPHLFLHLSIFLAKNGLQLLYFIILWQGPTKWVGEVKPDNAPFAGIKKNKEIKRRKHTK
jgi:hypothetical protein